MARSINKDKCIGCGKCMDLCPVFAVGISVDGTYRIHDECCIDCSSCEGDCPMGAIENDGGVW